MKKAGLLLSVLVILGGWAIISSALAATVTVTNTNDSGTGSLRNAITSAAPGDTIDFSIMGTITLTSGEITIDKNLAISGPGASSLAISGNNSSRIFSISSGTIVIANVTIQNGSVPSNNWGGAIYISNASVVLTIDSCVFSDNHADATYSDGGAIFATPSGDLTITNSVFTGNTANDEGGAIWYDDQNGKLTISNSTFLNNIARNGDGGAIEFIPPNAVGARSFSITDSTFSNNSAKLEGGAVYICCANNTVTISGSTFSGNTAGDDGGGLYNCCGAGGQNAASTVSITNSTLSGNTATSYYGGGITAEGPVVLNYVTMNGNGAPTGGGIYTDEAGFSTLSNTIVANSTSGGNCGGDPVTSLGHNLSSDNTCSLAGTGDMNNTNPLLGVLANNGGPTRTHALLFGSPAIDGGNPSEFPPTDQRGVTRPFGLAPDIGAYESDSPIMSYEGTLGTIMTISGSGFGEKKGKVLIGGVATKIAKGNWSDTTIACTVKKVLPPGETYDVTIMIPKTTTPVTLPVPFTYMNPELDPLAVNHATPGTELTVTGGFFSTKKGKVYLEDSNGKQNKCKVTEWYMDPPTGESRLKFIVPTKLPSGSYTLGISNKVGAVTTPFAVDPPAP